MTVGDKPAQLGQIEAADAMIIDGKIVTRDDYRALAAQVEVLRDALQCLFNDIGGGKKFCGHEFSCVCAGDKARAALATTPQQPLAEIRAEAGRDGYLQALKDSEHRIDGWYGTTEEQDEQAANQYADSIRKGE